MNPLLFTHMQGSNGSTMSVYVYFLLFCRKIFFGGLFFSNSFIWPSFLLEGLPHYIRRRLSCLLSFDVTLERKGTPMEREREFEALSNIVGRKAKRGIPILHCIFIKGTKQTK